MSTLSTPLMARLSKLANDCAALAKSQPNISPLLLAEMAATATLASEEIERLRLEHEELRACFGSASRGMSHKEVFELIAGAKQYVQDRRKSNA